MCQFARLYPLTILEKLATADKALESPTVEKVLSIAKKLNECESIQQLFDKEESGDNKIDTFAQQVVAQIQTVEKTLAIITQQPVAQTEQLFLSTCVSRLN